MVETRGIPSAATLSIDLLIDVRNLTDPDGALSMFHLQNIIHRPVEVICDVGYLLVETVQGVAYNSPAETAPRSTWNGPLQ